MLGELNCYIKVVTINSCSSLARESDYNVGYLAGTGRYTAMFRCYLMVFSGAPRCPEYGYRMIQP